MTQHRFMAMVLVLASTSLVVLSAETKPAESHLRLGLRHMTSGQWDQAEKEFVAHIAADPADVDAQVLLGMSRYHLGRYMEAARTLQYALDRKTSYASRALYYLGLAQSRLKNTAEAGKAFRTLVNQYPNSVEAIKVAPDLPREKAAWTVREPFITVDVTHDSNAGNTTDGKGDIFLSTSASARAMKLPGRWNAGASFFIDKYLDQDAYDFMFLSGDIQGEYEPSLADALTPQLELNQSWLGGDAYERVIGMRLLHDRRWTDLWTTQARLLVDLHTSLDDEAANSDGTLLSFRIRGWRKCDGPFDIAGIRPSAQLTIDSADTAYLGYTDITAGVLLRFLLHKQVTLDVTPSYKTRDYDSSHPVYGKTRSDSEVGCRFDASQPWSMKTTLTATLAFAQHDSNIDYYSYDEVVVGVGLTYAP